MFFNSLLFTLFSRWYTTAHLSRNLHGHVFQFVTIYPIFMMIYYCPLGSESTRACFSVRYYLPYFHDDILLSTWVGIYTSMFFSWWYNTVHVEFEPTWACYLVCYHLLSRWYNIAHFELESTRTCFSVCYYLPYFHDDILLPTLSWNLQGACFFRSLLFTLFPQWHITAHFSRYLHEYVFQFFTFYPFFHDYIILPTLSWNLHGHVFSCRYYLPYFHDDILLPTLVGIYTGMFVNSTMI